MTRHNPELSLSQILQFSKEAIQLCEGRDRSDLNTDRMLNLALSRLIEMIGEAANRIPTEVQIKYHEIPWLQMIGARNRMIHGYDSVDFDILWNIVTKDLPLIVTAISKIIK